MKKIKVEYLIMEKVKVTSEEIEIELTDEEFKKYEEKLKKLKNCEGDFQKDIWTFVTQYLLKNYLNVSFSDIVLLKLQGWL